MPGPIYRKRRNNVGREGRVALKFAVAAINSSLVSDTLHRSEPAVFNIFLGNLTPLSALAYGTATQIYGSSTNPKQIISWKNIQTRKNLSFAFVWKVKFFYSYGFSANIYLAH